jgi:Polyketide cyclase / dehydrase and lipid transport
VNVNEASADVAVPAEEAFAYLADGIDQGEWTLGSWNREQVDRDLFRGTSLVSGRELYVRVRPDRERLVVDCDVGGDPGALVHRIAIVVEPNGDGCRVTLRAWRTPDQSDESWRQTQDLHAAEVHLIKGRLELRRRVRSSGPA